MAKIIIKLAKNNEGRCLSAICVQYMSTYENETQAALLSDYTLYKTSTGEIRYKLPTSEPSLLWLDTNIWDDSEIWID